MQQRKNVLHRCGECVRTLQENIGTVHFNKFLNAARYANEVFCGIEAEVEQHRLEHGC